MSVSVSLISLLPRQVTTTHRSSHQAASQIRFVGTSVPELHRCQATQSRKKNSSLLFSSFYSYCFQLFHVPLNRSIHYMSLQRLWKTLNMSSFGAEINMFLRYCGKIWLLTNFKVKLFLFNIFLVDSKSHEKTKIKGVLVHLLILSDSPTLFVALSPQANFLLLKT